jgi:hypothetical protein
MPTQNQHVTQAIHNHTFWTSFDTNSTAFLDWVVTGMFYEGVHWAEAVLSAYGEHPTNHKQRFAAMNRHQAEMGPIIMDLETLKTESENARYMCYKHTPGDLSNDLTPLIVGIRTYTQSKFGIY